MDMGLYLTLLHPVLRHLLLPQKRERARKQSIQTRRGSFSLPRLISLSLTLQEIRSRKPRLVGTNPFSLLRRCCAPPGRWLCVFDLQNDAQELASLGLQTLAICHWPHSFTFTYPIFSSMNPPLIKVPSAPCQYRARGQESNSRPV